MIITRSHILNTLFWIVLIFFMAFKSIEHTVDVHYQGVIRTIQQYKIPADARYSILMDLINESNQSSVFLELDDLLLRIKQSNNLSEYLTENIRLTQFVDLNIDQLLNDDERIIGIGNLQEQLNIEQMIYNAHAHAFNQLVDSWPYRLIASDQSLFLIFELENKGLVIER